MTPKMSVSREWRWGAFARSRKVPIRRLRFCREQSNALEAVCFHSYTKFLHVVSEAGAKLLSWRVRWGEIARLREALCDSFAGGRTFEIPPESLRLFLFALSLLLMTPEMG